MEALTAVAVAGLTLHDMIKAVDPAAVLSDVRLERKEGGKTGVWTRPEEQMSARRAVVAASNRAAAGVYEDRTGPVIVAWLRARGFDGARPGGGARRRAGRGGAAATRPAWTW